MSENIKSAITTAFDPNLPYEAAVSLIAEAGFDAVSLSWEPAHIDYATQKGQKEIIRLIERNELLIEFLQGAPSRLLTERVLQEFPQSHIGLCHDTGHEHCSLDCFKALESMGNRLFCTHVHDDTGQGKDDHLLPYKGTIDWDLYIEVMRKLHYSGYLLIEAVRNRADGFDDSMEFLIEAKSRASKLITAIEAFPQR